MLILATSAEIEYKNVERTDEYLESINWLLSNAGAFRIVWLECVASFVPYLKDKLPVFYSNCHNPYFQNKGANLGMALKRYAELNFIPENLILQMTGRYHFQSNYLFELIMNNPGYDLYAKSAVGRQYFTGCFAMNTSFFIDWICSTNWDEVNAQMINFEKVLWTYAKNKNLKIYEVDKIHMSCNVFGSGHTQRINL
jgi:hypothetical protein